MVAENQSFTNTQFVYDAAGRCVQIAENGSTPSYSGNAIKNFLWCGAERCEERDNSNAVVSVFCGLGQKTSGTNEFYSFDHLGSIREVTNGSGTVQGAFDFDPYGNMSVLSGSVKPDFGFAGIYQHSRTNLALTWFRQYNPGVGRWLNRDPLGEDAGLNLYGYSQNNPISFVDPFGLAQRIGSFGNGQGIIYQNDDGSIFTEGAVPDSSTELIIAGLGASTAKAGLIAAGASCPVKASTSLLGQSFGKLGTVVENPGLRVTGFLSEYAANRALTRFVSAGTIAATVNAPIVVLQQTNGRFVYISNQAVVVLDSLGKVVTTYGPQNFDAVIRGILSAAGH